MHETSITIVDSFRTRDITGVTEARMISMHLERFAWNVTEALGEFDDPDPEWYELQFEPFLDEATQEIAEGGEGFPRLEFVLNDEQRSLNVRLRPLPKLTTTLDLRTAPPQHLVMPWLKGPNIPVLAQLNAALCAEALLTTPSGKVSEGATTALLWWDGDTLCVSDHTERVDSITEQLIQAIAQQAGHALSERSVRPVELAGHEVWAVNALHGIRVVKSLDGSSLLEPDRARLSAFRDALEDTWQPLLFDEGDLEVR